MIGPASRSSISLIDKSNKGLTIVDAFMVIYANIYSREIERMGKAAGDIVQECVADVEAGAVAYTCGATADRDRDSASLLFCHGRRRGLVRQSIER
jgi:hypothetical protein